MWWQTVETISLLTSQGNKIPIATCCNKPFLCFQAVDVFWNMMPCFVASTHLVDGTFQRLKTLICKSEDGPNSAAIFSNFNTHAGLHISTAIWRAIWKLVCHEFLRSALLLCNPIPKWQDVICLKLPLFVYLVFHLVIWVFLRFVMIVWMNYPV